MKRRQAKSKRPVKLRERLEEFLSKNPAAIKKIPPREILDLFEDLQIYQIDLESGLESIIINENIPPFHWAVAPEGVYYHVANDKNEPLLKLYLYPERTTKEIGVFDKWHCLSDVSKDAKHFLLWTHEDYAADIFLVENFRY